MKIIIDVMSGDNAPQELLRGALLAQKELGEEIIAVGDEEIIRRTAESEKLDLSPITVIHAPGVITMEDSALSVVQDKADSSMGIGLQMLARGDGDAFVSAGNTGALLAGATLLVRRIKGIHRAAIATVLPFPTPCLLMDSGANLEVTPANLEQFGFMGARYMEKLLQVNNPRIGLLNNGTEPTKGTELQRDAFVQLSDSEMTFVGNVEGKSVPFGVCDVLVTDGFTGNILLKYTEGMGIFLLQTMKELFSNSVVSKLAAVTMKGKLKDLRRQFDAGEYGGAPILGISKPVIKAHGSSDAHAIKNAVRQAINFNRSGINRDIAVYAIDFDERMKARAKARGKAEKAARKQKRKEDSDEQNED